MPAHREMPSTGQETRRRPATLDGTAGGVNATPSKAHLMDLARRLDIRGRSNMTKQQLVDALMRASEQATRRSREHRPPGYA
jgi:Rho termination factor-like protein